MTLAATESINGQIVSVDAERLSELSALQASMAPTEADYSVAIQAHIDDVARGKSYADGVSCASYAGSTNTQWAGEAATFISWRDSVWSYAYAEVAKVKAGTRTAPTILGFLAELPAIEWAG